MSKYFTYCIESAGSERVLVVDGPHRVLGTAAQPIEPYVFGAPQPSPFVPPVSPPDPASVKTPQMQLFSGE